jgi:PAS domain S-box-containing protein
MTQQPGNETLNPIRLPRFVAALVLGWTACVTWSLCWNLHQTAKELHEVALATARSSYGKDILYRHWNASHGGVYVPVTAATPPNPYLEAFERDITTPSGRALTLMNPAYMTRQVHEMSRSQRQADSRLTSLDLLNPANAADPWERAALQRLAQGAAEVSTVETRDGSAILRLIRPMRVEASCLPCHARQGYRLGEVRGGLSVSVPMTELLAIYAPRRSAIWFGHGLLWLTGLLGLGLGNRWLGAQIREREAADQALGASEKRFRSIFENAGAGMNTITPDGRYLQTNQAFRDFIGYSDNELQALTVFDLTAAEDMERTQSLFDEVRRGGTTAFNYEKRFLRKDGETVWGAVTTAWQLDARGTPLHAVGLIQDITGRKQAEQILRESQRRFNEMLANIRLCAVILDRDASIVFANDFLLELSGWQRPEILGRNWFECFIPETVASRVREIFTTTMEDGSYPATYENEILTRQGELRLIRWNNTLLRSAEGEIIGAASIGENITELRALENQLRHAQKMEAIGTLTGGIAHDFNNILTAIVGHASLLEMKLDAREPLHGHVRQVLTAADRAAQLTRSLLTFSRKQPFELRPLDLNELAERSGQLLARLIREDIALHISPAASALTVRADGGQLEQVLMNLVTNAQDAMPQGGTLSIRVSRANLDAAFVQAHGFGIPGDYALIEVSDTGIGMDEATRLRIFEPFFTTKPTGKGTGFGLAIVYGIVKQHGGYINCYSEPGKGTTFRLYLPALAEKSRALAPAEAVPLQAGTETILLAEDDALVRAVNRALLEQAGYTVIEAADGHAALAQIAAHGSRIRLAILDLIMPGENGWQVCEELHRLRPGLPVLFTSGYAAETLAATEPQKKPAEFMAKPLPPTAFLAKVREILDC